jgi:hypothetical protein
MPRTPVRNRTVPGDAWRLQAVATILANPRYGRYVTVVGGNRETHTGSTAAHRDGHGDSAAHRRHDFAKESAERMIDPAKPAVLGSPASGPPEFPRARTGRPWSWVGPLLARIGPLTRLGVGNTSAESAYEPNSAAKRLLRVRS